MSSSTDKLKFVETPYLKKGLPDFKVGDTVSVHVKIIEDEKVRTQVFDGIVIARKGSGLRSTFTVRKISFGEGVERIFPLHSPTVEKIIIQKKGEVRRAKLYYLRKKVGKASKIKEHVSSETESPEARDAILREESKKEGV